MTRSVFFFECSTDEGFSYVLEFSGLVLTDRTFQVLVKDRATSTVRATLTTGDGLTLESATVISAAVAKSAMTAWPRGEYSADLVDTTGGGASRIMAVRFSYDLPGNLVNGVGNRKAFVTWSDNTALVTATGAVGPSGPPGPQGWSPELATVSDGARRVLQVVDWVGGLGTKPEAGGYVGATGLVPLIADAIDIRGPQGAEGPQGDEGDQGIQGEQGDKGWSPQFAVVADGTRRVLRVTGWTGGAGTAPATGDYIGPTGLVSAIGDAIDIRGPAGTVVAPGSIDTGDLADGILTADATGRAKMADGFTTFAKMQDIATARVLGRVSAGSGDVEELDDEDLRGLVPDFVGDTGSGGEAGLVPAPPAGAAAGNHVLGADGTWRALAQGMVIIETQTAAGDASIDFTDGLNDSFDSYEIEMTGVRVATDDTGLLLRIRTGSTWQTSGYLGMLERKRGGSASISLSNPTSYIALTEAGGTTGIANVANRFYDGIVRFANPDAAGFCRFRHEGAYDMALGDIGIVSGGGRYNIAGAITGIRIQAVGGVLPAGVFVLRGKPKT